MSEVSISKTSKKWSWPWAYDPTVAGKRDLRLDFLRGLAICSMVVNHLESRSYFNRITQGNIYASSAEGFVFLSGFVLGMVTLGRIGKLGWKPAMVKLVERAGTLYCVSFILMAVLGLASIFAPGWTRPAFEEAPGSWWQILLAAATFRLAPPVIDILQLYVVCLLVSPLIFWLLDRGLWMPVLAGTWGLWLIQQTHPYALSIEPLNRDHHYFVFAGWQILYVNGLLMGYYRHKIGRLWQKIPKIPLLIVMLGIVIAAMIAAKYDMQLGMWPSEVHARAAWLRWTDRSRIGFIRIITLTGFFTLLYSFVNAFWRPLEKLLAGLLIPLGQNSLYLYICHVPVTVIWFWIPGLVTGSYLVTTIAQSIVIAIFWVMVRYKFLFNVIPR